MLYPYSIDDLSRECKVSKQSIYSLIKKNNDFVKANSTRQSKRIKYNQEVLNLFLSYYGLEQAQEEEHKEDFSHSNAIPGFQDNGNNITNTSLLDEANAKIEVLEGQIEVLKEELSAAREQIQELIKQNGEVLLLLQEEKQEKMKLLPAPRKSFTQKIKDLFKG